MDTDERAVLFADLDGYTALTEAHGDLDGFEVASRFAATARQLLRADARLVKTIGDAVLIVSNSPDDALDIATELVSAVDAIDHYPSVSAGIHSGPVVEHDGDVFGRAVNLAARAAAHARPGQVLCTASLVKRLEPGRRAQVKPLGEVRFPNVPEPVALYARPRATRRLTRPIRCAA